MEWKFKKFIGVSIALSLSLSLSAVQVRAATHSHSDSCYRREGHQHVGDGGLTKVGCYTGTLVQTSEICGLDGCKIPIVANQVLPGISYTEEVKERIDEWWTDEGYDSEVYHDYTCKVNYTNTQHNSTEEIWRYKKYTKYVSYNSWSPFTNYEPFALPGAAYELYCVTCKVPISKVVNIYNVVNADKQYCIDKLSCSVCGWSNSHPFTYLDNSGEIKTWYSGTPRPWNGIFFCQDVADHCYIQHFNIVERYGLSCNLTAADVVTVQKLCDTCGGTGVKPNTTSTKCITCNGTKTVAKSFCGEVVTAIKPKR